MTKAKTPLKHKMSLKKRPIVQLKSGALEKLIPYDPLDEILNTDLIAPSHQGMPHN